MNVTDRTSQTADPEQWMRDHLTDEKINEASLDSRTGTLDLHRETAPDSTVFDRMNLEQRALNLHGSVPGVEAPAVLHTTESSELLASQEYARFVNDISTITPQVAKVRQLMIEHPNQSDWAVVA